MANKRFNEFFIQWDSNAHWQEEDLLFQTEEQLTEDEFREALRLALLDFLKAEEYELPARMREVYGWDMVEEEEYHLEPYFKKHGVSLKILHRGPECVTHYMWVSSHESLID